MILLLLATLSFAADPVLKAIHGAKSVSLIESRGSHPIEAGRVLSVGTRLHTGPSVWVEIVFANGARVELGRLGELELLVEGPGRMSWVRLHSGVLRVTLPPHGKPAVGIQAGRTMDVVSRKAGASFLIENDSEARRLALAVTFGEAELRVAGEESRVVRKGHALEGRSGDWIDPAPIQAAKLAKQLGRFQSPTRSSK